MVVMVVVVMMVMMVMSVLNGRARVQKVREVVLVVDGDLRHCGLQLGVGLGCRRLCRRGRDLHGCLIEHEDIALHFGNVVGREGREKGSGMYVGCLLCDSADDDDDDGLGK